MSLHTAIHHYDGPLPQRLLMYALDRGYGILPITVDDLPCYQVYRRGISVARCQRLEEAAEVAAALASFDLAPIGASSSPSQAGESLAPGLAQGN